MHHAKIRVGKRAVKEKGKEEEENRSENRNETAELFC